MKFPHNISRLEALSDGVCAFTATQMAGALSIVLASLNAGVWWGLPGFIYALLGPLCYWHAPWFERKFSFENS